jgi:thiamine-phosphate pyrophosphorylase
MNTRAIGTRRGLYLLTPDQPDSARLLAAVAPVLAGGAVAVLQLRNKLATPAQLRQQALALLPICRGHAIALIINDDWRLAADIGADGAHLGEHDGDLPAARAALGPAAILGASCYDDLGRAGRAAAAGASYLAFGAFFATFVALV